MPTKGVVVLVSTQHTHTHTHHMHMYNTHLYTLSHPYTNMHIKTLHMHARLHACTNTPTQPYIQFYGLMNFMKSVMDGKLITFTLDQDVINQSNRL